MPKTSRNRFSPAEDAQLVALRVTGASWYAIGSALKRRAMSCRARMKLLESRRVARDPGAAIPAGRPVTEKKCLRCREPFTTDQPRQVHMCEPCKAAIRRNGDDDCSDYSTHGSAAGGGYQISSARPPV